jgi:hypothetical protein
MPIFFRVPATKTCCDPNAVAYTAFARRYASNSASRCPSRYETCPRQINVDASWDASSCLLEEEEEEDDESIEGIDRTRCCGDEDDPRDDDDDEDEDDTVNGIETC